ncbi:unnamed protein product [Cuscuta campestris]|uniref:F-box associated domain-containing protein n=1 Tax=Cuscuta campestris TaxID=132261 RepID=A0A484KP28_9ASTE|nr:unnamed protein product [Cuscuta campestris]
MEVWIMKEYGVKESWVRQFVILVDEWCVPLVQMDTGKILIKSGDGLYLCNPWTQVFEKVKFEINGLSNCMVPLAAFDARFFRF